MKKFKTLAVLVVSLGLVGCNTYGLENKNVDNGVTTVESIEAEQVVVEDTAIVKALKEKYNYRDASEFMSTSDQAMMIKLNNEYSYSIVNEVDDTTGVETIAKFESVVKDDTKYNIKLMEVPMDSKDFLLSNPLRLSETDNESTNKFIDLICVDNIESDTALKVMDNEGNEHTVTKYEVRLDMTVLDIEGLGVHRETPTYYAIENGDSYIVILITEEILSELDVEIEKQAKEAEEAAQLETDTDTGETGAVENSELDDNTAAGAEVIIEDNTDEEQVQQEIEEHKEKVNSEYSELDDKTKNHIETIKKELLKKELVTEDTHSERLIAIDKVAYDFINNIMIGRFEQY